jgi:hypothetical protein
VRPARVASLFTPGGALRMPHINVELAGLEEIRAWGERVPALVHYFVQTTHPGVIRLDGDTASGRAYISELIRFRDGRSELNYAISTTTGTSATRKAGGSRSGSTRSGISTPLRWPARLGPAGQRVAGHRATGRSGAGGT